MVSNKERASILVEALPYIKKYAGETIVIKYGGNAMVNDQLKQAVMNDLVLMQFVGINVVVVHGGGPSITEMLNKIGKKSHFVDGLRYTDQETMEIVQQVLAGKVNKDLVHLLEDVGGKAIGLCGIDGSLLKAKQLNETLGYVGEITEVNVNILNDSIKNGYIPIVSTIASGSKGEVYNINADTAASIIAAELNATKLILMSDIKGLLTDINDENSIISIVNVSDVKLLQNKGIIKGGMIPKIECCVDAVRRGVNKAHIVDGRIPHSILIEMFTDEGIGTMFVSNHI